MLGSESELGNESILSQTDVSAQFPSLASQGVDARGRNGIWPGAVNPIVGVSGKENVDTAGSLDCGEPG